MSEKVIIKNRRKTKFTDKYNIGLSLFAALISLIVLAPLYIIIINSFKDSGQIFIDTIGWPETFNLENYQYAWDRMNYLSSLKNSVYVVGISVILIVIVASMAGWAIARRNTRGSNFLYYLFMSTILIPFQSVMLPLVQYFTRWRFNLDFLNFDFKMVGSLYGLIFFNVGFGLAISVTLYVAAVRNIPLEIEESATIDGASRAQLFWRVIFPNLKTTSATVAVLNIFTYWNDYLLPSLILSQDPELRTIPLSTFYFFGQFNIQWNYALAGLVLTIIPVLLFYLFAQRWIVAGMMAGSVKG